MAHYLSRVELEKLSTPRLLAYKNKNLITFIPPEGIEDFHLTYEEWQGSKASALVILSNRENIPTKPKKRRN